MAEATDLIERLGSESARLEAASRADASRNLGNVLKFCHWRQIERTIVMLEIDGVAGSVH